MKRSLAITSKVLFVLKCSIEKSAKNQSPHSIAVNARVWRVEEASGFAMQTITLESRCWLTFQEGANLRIINFLTYLIMKQKEIKISKIRED